MVASLAHRVSIVVDKLYLGAREQTTTASSAPFGMSSGSEGDFCANYFNFKLISFAECSSEAMVRIQNEFARIFQWSYSSRDAFPVFMG